MKFVGFAFAVILSFCLLQTAVISQWVECNDSSLGKVVSADGSEYICSSLDGGFGWQSKYLQDTVFSLPVLIVIIAFSVAFILL